MAAAGRCKTIVAMNVEPTSSSSQGASAQEAAFDAQSPRRRTKAPQTRRGDLMDAAERLFLGKGIAATSIDDIVLGAQVAKGTFYLYFSSKEALLGALQERFIEAFCDRLQRAMDRHRPDNWRARLRSWVDAGINTYLDHVALHDVVFHEYRPQDRRLKNDNPVIDQLAKLLGQGAAAGAWKVDDARLSAVILFNALHGVADDAVAAGRTAERRRLANSLANFFERALCAG